MCQLVRTAVQVSIADFLLAADDRQFFPAALDLLRKQLHHGFVARILCMCLVEFRHNLPAFLFIEQIDEVYRLIRSGGKSRKEAYKALAQDLHEIGAEVVRMISKEHVQSATWTNDHGQ